MFENYKNNIIENSNIFFTIMLIFIPYFTWLIRRNNNNHKNIFLDLKKKIKNKNLLNNNLFNKNNNNNSKKKIGLLTNELPPIIYGGVSTWILNFMKMFKNDNNFEVIPIFLAYQDKAPNYFPEKYPGIRIINSQNDLIEVFQDIDILVNNLWIALETIKEIKILYPFLPIISVCHSLIKMEHITNLGSQYTNNWAQQEVTFQNSDYVILISKAEKKYYESFGYDKFNAIPIVIYNSYQPKYDSVKLDVDYSKNVIGYLGRHVPRKRAELAVKALYSYLFDSLKKYDTHVINMGVDYSRGGNKYWDKLNEKYDKLKIIPFSCDKLKIKTFWNSIGVNSITGIYEPFGYTMCETLDRRMPAIVQNIDGPSEIIGKLKENVFMYNVEQDIEKDIKNFSKAVQNFWDTSPEKRKEMAEKARKALDRFRPNVIKEDWKNLFKKIK